MWCSPPPTTTAPTPHRRWRGSLGKRMYQSRGEPNMKIGTQTDQRCSVRHGRRQPRLLLRERFATAHAQIRERKRSCERL
eukprot:353536-Chlamydomonas_euryale.AAC.3